MEKQKETKEPEQAEGEEEIRIIECPCLSCGQNLLQLIGLTPPHHLLFKCGSCGALQLINLHGKLSKIEAPPQEKKVDYLG